MASCDLVKLAEWLKLELVKDGYNEDVLKEIDDDDNNNSDDDETSLNQSANSYFVELDGNKYVIDDSDVADAMLDDGYGDLYDENGNIY